MKTPEHPRYTQFHASCFACGSDVTDGIHLNVSGNGGVVEGSVTLAPRFQGYTGIVHGGVVATVLDAAMVHCLHGLFGKAPFTCRLDTRFLREVRTGKQLTVSARYTRRRGGMCWAEGKLVEEGKTCVRALGVFKLV